MGWRENMDAQQEQCGPEDMGEGFYDDCGRFWPDDAEWCDRCQGMGTEECLCGGDFCCCGHGERECRQCGGDGYFVPTEAFKKARKEAAEWWSGLWAELHEQPATPTKRGDQP